MQINGVHVTTKFFCSVLNGRFDLADCVKCCKQGTTCQNTICSLSAAVRNYRTYNVEVLVECLLFGTGWSWHTGVYDDADVSPTLRATREESTGWRLIVLWSWGPRLKAVVAAAVVF